RDIGVTGVQTCALPIFEDEDHFRVDQLHGVFQRCCLSALAVGAMKGTNAPRISLDKFVNDFPSAIGGAIVDRNNQHLVGRVLTFDQCSQNVGHDFFFVMSRDQDGNRWPVGRINVDVRVPLEAEEAVQGEPVVTYGVDANDRDDDVENV